MKFGTSFPCTNYYPPALQPWEPKASDKDLAVIARAIDKAGFDYLSVSDHIIMSTELGEKMGNHWVDAIALLGMLCGATENVKVYTSVLVAPYRHPLILAKQFSSLDYLSGGRVVCGIGIGHQEKEFELLGISRPDRAAITDEYLEAIKVLWTEDNPEYRGKYVSFNDIKFEPKPTNNRHLPIWIGGNSRPGMRRAAKYGDGWVPWQITPQQLPECLNYMRDQAGFAEREATGYDIVMPTTIIMREEGTQRILGETIIPDGVQEWIDVVGANKDAGANVSTVTFGHTTTIQEYLDKIALFVEEVMPKFKD